jgi:hypothetical protein
VLEAYDWAYLHANLLRVRPLFAFCVDDGGEDGCGEGDLPGDGLPLVVFLIDLGCPQRAPSPKRRLSTTDGGSRFDADRLDRGRGVERDAQAGRRPRRALAALRAAPSREANMKRLNLQ